MGGLDRGWGRSLRRPLGTGLRRDEGDGGTGDLSGSNGGYGIPLVLGLLLLDWGGYGNGYGSGAGDLLQSGLEETGGLAVTGIG